MEARQLVPHDDELTLLVARIRAIGPSHPLTSPSTSDIAAVVARLRRDQSLDPVTLAAHEREWTHVEDTIRRQDEAMPRRNIWYTCGQGLALRLSLDIKNGNEETLDKIASDVSHCR